MAKFEQTVFGQGKFPPKLFLWDSSPKFHRGLDKTFLELLLHNELGFHQAPPQNER